MKLFAVVLFFGLSFISYSQDFSYLEDIDLKEAEDYKTHEETVINAIDFIMKTSTAEQKMNRTACSRFIINYASGSPTITVSLYNSILNLADKNQDVLVMYLGLFIKSSLLDEGEPEGFHQNYVLTEIARYCAKGNGIKRTKIIKSMVKAYEKNDLKAWIRDLK